MLVCGALWRVDNEALAPWEPGIGEVGPHVLEVGVEMGKDEEGMIAET